MSLRRRIALVFLAVNGITLAVLIGFTVVDTQRAARLFEGDRQILRERTSRLLAIIIEEGIRRELARSATEQRLDASRAAMRAISNQRYWDEDERVQSALDRVVIVRYDDFETILFNPRRRFVFAHGEAEKGKVRNLIENANGVENTGNVFYGRIDVANSGTRRWGFYFRLKEQDVGSADPIAAVRAVALITIPGTIFLLVFVYVFFSRSVMRPLAEISAGAARIAALDYQTPIRDVSLRGDELSNLVAILNDVMTRLRVYSSEMQRLVDEAADRFQEAQRRLVVAQQLASIGRLAAGIAHEINNPLGGILNILEKLAHSDLSLERRHEYSRLAEEAIYRIRDTVQRVLQSAPRSVELGMVPAAPIIDQAATLVHHRFVKQGIRFARTLPEGITVFGHRGELSQLFLNLFINACDAMPKGGSLEVRARFADDAMVEFDVADTGTGIAPEVLPHVFDLFFTTKSGNEGTGLGLGIVHTIVTSHGGTIGVDSTVGVGTTFTIRLRTVAPPDVKP